MSSAKRAHGLLVGEIERPDAASSRAVRAQQIVDVAGRILEDEGRSASTMRRIADELGIRAPSLYKHFASKAEIESALVEDAFFDIGDLTHLALHRSDRERSTIQRLVRVYRAYCLSRPNLYRLATTGPLDREKLPPGLEEWAGNPWFVVTGDPSLAQALWSFAHGMIMLELDERYPPGSDLDRTWRAGVAAFDKASQSPTTRRPERG